MTQLSRQGGLILSQRVQTAVIGNGYAVKSGTLNSQVILASAATDKIIGLSSVPGPVGTTAAIGDTIDIVVGFCSTEGTLGGSVVQGDMLTADSAGKLIATTTQANRAVGMALKDGSANDIIPVLVYPNLV